jgi:hypothetical protein
VSDGAFIEDDNRGGVFRTDESTSLRTPLPLGLTLDSSHSWGKKLNKIGYDPFGYHGLDRHSVTSRVSSPLGRIGTASVSGGYDLRNKQDPIPRRWFPISPQVNLIPVKYLTLGADGGFDVWYRKFRDVSGSIKLGSDSRAFVLLRPRYTNNRLTLPLAATTSQDYMISRQLYGLGYQDPVKYPRIFLTDGEAAFSILPRVRVSACGQYDLQARQVLFYTCSVTRNLHCWELTATFQKFINGEYRYQASLSLTAFPTEGIPLVGF